MNVNENTRIAEIISKKIAGTATGEENKLLDQWLSASGKNRALYSRLASGDRRRMREENAGSPDIARAIESIDAKIRRHRVRRLSLRTASAAAVVFATAAVIFGLTDLGDRLFRTGNAEPVISYQATLLLPDGREVVLSSTEEDTEWMEYIPTAEEVPAGDSLPAEENIIRVQVERGKEYKLRLPDGTSVWLNSASSIEYPVRFQGSSRQVTLAGEAFFDVEKDTLRPFGVTTQDMLNIRVLGTKFNVNSYSDEGQIQVSLLEGSVSVDYMGQGVVLHPNQQAVFDRSDGRLAARDVLDASIYSSWTTGLFDFESESLATIFSALSRRYDIEFVLEGVDISRLGHFTLHAGRGDDFSHVCEILRKITGLKYRVDGKQVYVSH